MVSCKHLWLSSLANHAAVYKQCSMHAHVTCGLHQLLGSSLGALRLPGITTCAGGAYALEPAG